MKETTHCGYIALVGRPNVGKSTLLNYLIGQKISITSPKPQTTRHCLLGIKTVEEAQLIYVDTPGVHLSERNAMNRYLNRTALNSLQTVDIIAWLVEALNWTAEDEHVLSQLKKVNVPLLLLISKIDKIKDKKQLLPYIQEIAAKHSFLEVFPISTFKRDNLSELEISLIQHLPLSPFLFPTDQVTDRSERFLSTEIIREKLIYALGAELPYRVSVQIESFNSEERLTRIHAIIWIERRSQKAIIIGKQGALLKSIGEQSRKEIEALLDTKVFLQLWVKVKEDWCDNDAALQQLGYT